MYIWQLKKSAIDKAIRIYCFSCNSVDKYMASKIMNVNYVTANYISFQADIDIYF